jgi:hypothetical protein
LVSALTGLVFGKETLKYNPCERNLMTSEEGFEEMVEEISALLKQQLTEAHNASPEAVENVIELHYVVHTIWSSIERLDWFKPYCSTLAHGLLQVFVCPELAFFSLRYVMDRCWRELDKIAGTRYFPPPEIEMLEKEKDRMYGRLSRIVHAEESPPGSIDQSVRLCIDSVDVISAILVAYLTSSLGKSKIELTVPGEEFETAEHLKQLIRKLNMKLLESCI